MKVLVLNSKIDFRTYFTARKLDIELEYRDLPIAPKMYKVSTKDNGSGVIQDFYAPDCLEEVRNIIEPFQYSYVVFGFDPTKYGAEYQSTGGYASYDPLYLGTTLVSVRMDGNEGLYTPHELLHAFAARIRFLGYPAQDWLDVTPVKQPDGSIKMVPYYKNWDREAPDSNHSQTWATIAPYKQYLGTFPPLLKKGSLSPWVLQYQYQLFVLGYKVALTGRFDSATDMATRALQKKNNLVVDGLVGKKTLAVAVKKKVSPSIDLSKWKLQPSLEAKAINFLTLAKEKGYNLKITQGYRDPAYQNKLYAQGRTTPGKIITNATGKTSKHCLGKAFDIAFVGATPYPKNTNWTSIGVIGEQCGLVWGGRFKSFKDVLHFEI